MKKLNLNTILFVALVVMALLLFRQCSTTQNLKDDLAIANQNQIALNDSVRVIKNKWGQDIYLKNILITDKKNLENLNADLSKEIKKLKGDILVLISAQGSIGHGDPVPPITITNTVTKYPDGLNELKWKFDTIYSPGNSRTLAGYSQFRIDTLNGNILDRGTKITEDKIKFKVSTGLTELDDTYQIFIKSDYPGLTFTQIDGAILDKKRFMKVQEPTVVWGPSISIGYGVNAQTQSLGPQLTLGISATLNVNKYIKKLFK